MSNEITTNEAEGRKWAGHSDDYLVGYTIGAVERSQNQAMIEMQRRLLVALREFNQKSSRQARVMIGLTVAILLLTGVLAWMASIQIWG